VNKSQQNAITFKALNWRRVHIIGGPGSGKTTLARKLGQYLGISVHELDKIAFEGPNFAPRPLHLRLAEIRDIASQPAWITEGMWLGWTDELLRSCDIIIWLDYLSWFVAAQRIVIRFARNSLKEVMYQSGLRKFTRIQDYKRNLMQLIGVLRSSRMYYHNQAAEIPTDFVDSYAYNRSVTATYLTPYYRKLMHLRNTSDVSVLLENLARRQVTQLESTLSNLNQEYLVSIIITNYNYDDFLKYAVDSALQQSYPAIEVIVVDDGSTDNSHDLILSYGNAIIPIFKQNGGQASAMNAGFRQSHGEIVIFLDADDMLLPGIVQNVVDAFSRHQNVAKVMYRMEVIDAAGQPTGEIKPDPHLPLRGGDLSRYILSFPFDMTWTATSGNAFAAEVLQKILPIPEEDFTIMADFYLSHLTPLLGLAVFLPEVGAYYRLHNANNFARRSRDLDLSQIRGNILYAHKTCIYIQEIADKLKLEKRPNTVSELFSVSILSKRLTSLKLDPDRHPIKDDTAWHLFQSGVIAAWRRFDVSWLMKIMYTFWFILMLPAPKPIAYWLASVFSLPEKRQILNRFLGAFHYVLKEENE
jgi:glycosyltransferase involved in cell wall biosynthesis